MRNKWTFLFSTLLLVAALVIGCTKSEKEAPLADQAQLSEDALFIRLGTETFDYLAFFGYVMKERGLTPEKLAPELNRIQAQVKSYDDQMAGIDRAFGTKVSHRLQLHMETYQATWGAVTRKYGVISSEVLERELTQVVEKYRGKESTLTGGIQGRDEISSMPKCGWRYTACNVAALAATVGCHAACETTALATTAGFGIPACVALCAVAQGWMGVQCYDNYCH